MVLARIYLSVNEQKKTLTLAQIKGRSWFGNGWVALISSFVDMAIITFICTYPLSANMDPSSWSQQKSALFISLTRPAFLICLIFLFYILFLNHGLFLKRGFSANMWAVLARLSYANYLVFPITTALFNSSMKTPLYLTYNEMFF